VGVTDPKMKPTINIESVYGCEKSTSSPACATFNEDNLTISLDNYQTEGYSQNQKIKKPCASPIS
jgi:hypothetical protein